MIAYGENIKVFCGNSNPEFARTICKELGIELGNSEGGAKTIAKELAAFIANYDKLDAQKLLDFAK